MFVYALSVPEAIRGIVAKNPVYLQALELGIANFTAIAERIKPEVEKRVGFQVNLNTIVVAIKRLADNLGEKSQQRLLEGEKLERHSDFAVSRPRMSLTGSIIDIDFQKESNNYEQLFENILYEFSGEYNHYNLLQTDNHFKLLAEEDADKIRNILSNAIEKFDGKISKGLSKISISLSSNTQQNLYYLLSVVSNISYNHQIPLHSAFFTSTETILILNDKDAAKAYDLIRMKMI